VRVAVIFSQSLEVMPDELTIDDKNKSYRNCHKWNWKRHENGSDRRSSKGMAPMGEDRNGSPWRR